MCTLMAIGRDAKDEVVIDMHFELAKDIWAKKDLVHEGAASETVRNASHGNVQQILVAFSFKCSRDAGLCFMWRADTNLFLFVFIPDYPAVMPLFCPPTFSSISD